MQHQNALQIAFKNRPYLLVNQQPFTFDYFLNQINSKTILCYQKPISTEVTKITRHYENTTVLAPPRSK